MELVEKAEDLRRLIQLSHEHPKLKIFVDDPPIILEPSNSTHTTQFNDPQLVQLFSEGYFSKLQ
jgi:hypothetical protein